MVSIFNIILFGVDDVEEIEVFFCCFIDYEGLYVYVFFMLLNEGCFNMVIVVCLLKDNCLLIICDDELVDFCLLWFCVCKG